MWGSSGSRVVLLNERRFSRDNSMLRSFSIYTTDTPVRPIVYVLYKVLTRYRHICTCTYVTHIIKQWQSHAEHLLKGPKVF